MEQTRTAAEGRDAVPLRTEGNGGCGGSSVKARLADEAVSLANWEKQMTLEEKRTLLGAIERFDVHPAKVRSRFDPERIRETWRFSD